MTLFDIALWFAGLSVISFVLMGLDKRAAQNGGWRVAERTLLLWAFLGGAIGAKLAQRQFRHKTRKQPFATLLNLAVAGNLMLAVLFLVPKSQDAALGAIRAFL